MPTLLHNTQTDQYITPPAKLLEFYLAKPQWKAVDQVAVGELKGQALDDALDKAGLSKSGRVDEKRARLAAHVAGVDHSEDDSEDDEQDIDPDEVTTTIPSQDQ